MQYASVFIGVDGGATKTKVVITDRNERILGEAQTGPSHHRIAGPLAAARNIRTGITQALKQAHVSIQSIAGSCLGLAGIDADKDNASMKRALIKIVSRSITRKMLLVNDVFIGYASGSHEPIGAAIIAGTGSNAVAFGPRGNVQRASGLGYLLSDDGSGYWIAIHALRAATRSYDQRGPKTSLERIITRRFGVQRMRDITPFIYDPAVTKKDIAALSPLVDKAAFTGDRVARRILEDAADALALMATTVIREAKIQRRAIPLVLIGSVFSVRKVLLPRFKRTVRKVIPNVIFIQPAVPFAVGAARLAIRRFLT